MEDTGDYNVVIFCCMYMGCDKTYSTKFNLKRHVETIHLNKKRHYCEECKRWFASKQNLVEHMYTHSGEKPFQCNLCPKIFRQASQLSLHQRKHYLEDVGYPDFEVVSKEFEKAIQKGIENNTRSESETHCLPPIKAEA